MKENLDGSPADRLSRSARNVRHIWRSLTEPRSADEDLKRREYILNVILFGSILMLAAIDALILSRPVAQDGEYRGISSALLFVFPAFFTALYVMSRRGFSTLASYLLVGAYFLGASCAAYEWGANLETALLSYTLIIVIANVLIGTKFGFWVTAATGGLLISLWYLQWHHLIPFPKEQPPDANDAAIFTVLYFFIMAVAWLSNREIERSLARARRSEHALKEQKGLLELKVEERTRELRHSELQKIEHLYQFAEFGQLSSGLFHDLVNVINAASLQNERAVSQTAKGSLENVRKMNKRIEGFVQAMRRQLAREETQEVFSVQDSIGQVIQLLAYRANKEKVRLCFAEQEGSRTVCFGNPFKFHQIMMNLVLNALESYEAFPRKDARERSVEIRVEGKGKWISVSVRDRGCGIPNAIREQIFKPFFTTKRAPRGIGIGLATTKKIVEQDFRGAIKVESMEGEGTVFMVSLPSFRPSPRLARAQ